MISQQLLPPDGGRCDSGHVAGETFRNKPTMWFEVTQIEEVLGKRVPKTLGTYCELCVTLARKMANQKKKQETGTDIDPETVLRRKLQRKK